MISRTMERQQGHDASAFPLMKLPRELRDHVYRLMVTPILRYHGIAPENKGLFVTAILCTNREVHSEASVAIAEVKIRILVDFQQLFPQPGSHREYQDLEDYFTLLPFKRYSIDFDFTNRTMCAPGRMGHTDCLHNMQRRIHDLTKALSNKAQFEQLHISCFIPKSDSSQNDDTNLEQGHRLGLFPDEMMDCFFQLRGLQDVVITGTLADAYVGRLTYPMKHPKPVPHADALDTKPQSRIPPHLMPLRRWRHKTCIFGCSPLAIKDTEQLTPDQHH